MTGFVVTVVFRVQPEKRAAFRKAILENAAASVRDEPGCSVFDVCESADGSEIFLYEVYDDEAAFGAHLASIHYKTFNALVTPWTAEKRVAKYARLS